MSRRPLMFLAIALVLVIDVVLVALVLRRTESAPVNRSSTLPVETSVVPTVPADATSPAPPAADPGAAPGELWLVDVAAGDVLRAKAGTCADGGLQLAFRSSGGAAFAEWAAPADFAVRITLDDAGNAWLVGGDRGGDCDLDFFRTRNGGRDWQRSESTDNAWHLLADPAAAQLHTPDGPTDSPCGDAGSAVDLAGVTTEVAFVLCSDSSLYVTDQAGRSWTPLATQEGARAVAFASEQAGYLAAPDAADCAGVGISPTDDGGESWLRAVCVDGLGEGTARVAADGDWVVVQVGGRTALSDDRGVTWTTLD